MAVVTSMVGLRSFMVKSSDVKPRGQIGLEAKILTSASTSWSQPQSQAFGLGLASVLLT